MKKFTYLITLCLVIFITGCGTTSMNYNESNNKLILTNNGKEMVIPDIIPDKQALKHYVVQNRGNERVTIYKGINSECKYVIVTELLPLGRSRYYVFSVADDIEEIYNVRPEKKDNFYILKRFDKTIVAFEKLNGLSADSKTFIEMSPKCLTNNKK